MSERASPFSISVCKLILLCIDSNSGVYKSLNVCTQTDKQGTESSNFALGNIMTLLQHVILSGNPNNSVGLSQIHPHLQQDSKYDEKECSDESFNVTCMPLVNLLSQLSNTSNTDNLSITQESTSFLFWSSLKEAASSIDSMIDLFADLRDICKKSVIDRTSAQGIYIRRISLGFEELPFEAVGALWTAFHDYVERGASFFDNNNPISDLDNTKASKNMHKPPHLYPPEHWKPSPRQLERRLHEKCLHFEKHLGTPNHSYEQVEAEIQYILTQHPELPAAHFLRFLNCLHHGEHVGAIDSLHRYFDYAMIRERRDTLTMASATASANSSQGNNSTPDNPNKDERASVVQYAAILLAALHYEFGNNFLSTKATEEAIRVAQQSGDTACVAYALAWLHQNNKNTISDGSNYNNHASRHQAEELLKRSHTQAVDHQITNLASGSYLALAKYFSSFSYNGRNTIANSGTFSHQPRSVWEILENAYIRPGGEIAQQAPTANRFVGHAAQTITNTNGSKFIAKNETLAESILTLSQQHLVASGVWETFGHMSLSSLTAVSSLHCYGKDLSNNEFALAVHKIAFSVLNGNIQHLSSMQLKENGEIGFEKMMKRQTSRNSLGSTKTHGWNESDDSTLKQSCVYPNALKKLHHLRLKHPIENGSPSGSIWTHSAILLLHEWALNRNELNHARSLSALLHTSSPFFQRNRIETTVQSLSQYSLSLCHDSSWKEAMTLTKRLCTICQEYGLRYHNARLLLQLTLLYLQLGSKDIGTITRWVLPSLLKCLFLCETFSMDSLHASAQSLLAKVYYMLNESQKAKAILNSVMPILLQHAPLTVQGEAWLTLAKCCISEFGQQLEKSLLSNSSSTKRPGSKPKQSHHKMKANDINLNPPCQRLFHQAYIHLQKSIATFEKVQNIKSLQECYYLMARLCYSCGSSETILGGEKCLSKAKYALKRYRELCQRILISSVWPVAYDVFLGMVNSEEMKHLMDR